MKILVSGSHGLIGSAFLQAAAAAGEAQGSAARQAETMARPVAERAAQRYQLTRSP